MTYTEIRSWFLCLMIHPSSEFRRMQGPRFHPVTTIDLVCHSWVIYVIRNALEHFGKSTITLNSYVPFEFLRFFIAVRESATRYKK